MLAARAGLDLLLCGRDPGAQRGLARALCAGRLDRSAFDAAVLRVLTLRASLSDSRTPGNIALSADDRTAIAATLRAYFDAINGRRFERAWRQLSPSLRASTTADHLAETDSTTHDVDVVLHAMTAIDGDTATVYVTFSSTQAANQGPDGDTRDDWTLDYTMTRSGGRWYIDSVGAHDGSTHTRG